MDEIRAMFSGVEDRKKLDSVIAAVAKKIVRKTLLFEEKSESSFYNALPLPVVPHEVVGVTASGKPVQFELVQQTVVFGQIVKPPVVVEYVTEKDHAKWRDAMREAVEKGLA